MSDNAPQQYAQEISEEVGKLIDEVLREQYRRHPELEKRYGPEGMKRCREDIDFHFCTLTEAIASEEREIWLNYVGWGKIVLVSRRVRLDHLIDTLLIMQEVISANVSKRAAAVANKYIQAAIDRMDSFPDAPATYIDPCAPLSKIANGYLQALLSVDRDEARKLVRSSLKNGTRLQDVFRFVF